MAAAMKMCRELYTRGEFTENLTIQLKEDWVKQHCSFEESEFDAVSKRKRGSEKCKREYPFKVTK